MIIARNLIGLPGQIDQVNVVTAWLDMADYDLRI